MTFDTGKALELAPALQEAQWKKDLDAMLASKIRPATGDQVDHPPHYNKGSIECIDAIDAALENSAVYYYQGAVLKYVYRMWHKDHPRQDAEKALWYLKRLVDRLIETESH